MTRFRRHGRKLIKCAVKLEHNVLGQVVAQVQDVSATGLYVTCKDLIGKTTIGDEFTAEVAGELPETIPSPLVVVRLTKDGVGFAYD